MTRPVNPETVFLNARLGELRAELAKGETAIGFSLTAENLGELAAGLTDALRQSGNEALATRFASAFTQVDQAVKAERRRLDANEDDAGTNDAMNEALDHFERVQADATAWFDRLEKESGA